MDEQAIVEIRRVQRIEVQRREDIIEMRRVQKREDIADCIRYWCLVVLFFVFIWLLAMLILYIRTN